MVITLKSSLTGEPNAITILKGKIKSANLNDALLEFYNGKKRTRYGSHWIFGKLPVARYARAKPRRCYGERNRNQRIRKQAKPAEQ